MKANKFPQSRPLRRPHGFRRSAASSVLKTFAACAAAALLAPVPTLAATDASHYFFGTPNGTSLLPPALPEVAGAGTYTSADGQATATFTLAPQASITLDVSGPTYIGAAFEYAYTITGPGFLQPGDVVAGTLTTTLSASGTGSMVAAAALVGSGLTLGGTTGVCFSTLGVCPAIYGTSLSGEVIPVNFSSSGTLEIATAARVFAGTAKAYIDPVITLPAGYTLTLSAGVGNGAPADFPPVSAVPEPSTGFALSAGLGLLCIFIRRTQRDGRA